MTKIRTSRYFDIILIFLFLVLFFTIDLMALVSERSKILVHGHRGARAILPENTLAGFQYAIDVGADILELDLAVTKDNVLVVSHDPSINVDICLDENGKKITNPPHIYDLTLEQVKKYDCGTLKNPKFANQKPVPKEKIPTLEEVFQLVLKNKNPHAQKVEFNIETKIFPATPKLTPTPELFSKLLFELIKKYKLESRTIVQSFDYRTLVALKKLNPKIRTAMLTSDNLVDFVAVAKAVKADFISPDWQWITKEDIQKLHKNNIKVAPWTANTEESWKYLKELGVDAIITDDPKALIEFLKK